MYCGSFYGSTGYSTSVFLNRFTSELNNYRTASNLGVRTRSLFRFGGEKYFRTVDGIGWVPKTNSSIDWRTYYTGASYDSRFFLFLRGGFFVT